MRKVYLNNIPRQEALECFLAKVDIPRRTEEIAVAEAAGRVTAAPVFAVACMPGYHAAAMDGIAVLAANTYPASDQNPVTLTENTDFLFVDTGNPLSNGFDAVIKIEDIQQYPGGKAEILAPATPWQHVRAVGEDVVAGELIVPAFHCLCPPDLGALLAGGITKVSVLQKPKVIIIPTGSDLIPPDQKRTLGAIPDFNSTVISAYLASWGAEPTIYPIIPDELKALSDTARKAAEEADLLLIIAGSSAGNKDFTYHAIKETGEVFVHGVATKPGKPTILGKIQEKPAIGLPGYPVSAYLSLEWFALPLLCRYLGQAVLERAKQTVTLGRRVTSEMGAEEHVRMSVGFINENFIANPLTRGAGVTMSLVRADALLVIPPESLGYEQNEVVEVELYRPLRALRHNLLVAGSHDLIIDLLATTFKERRRDITLSSTHLGSMGGIAAIGKGQAHLAGIHLFDSESGEYNLPYVKRYLPNADVLIVTLTHRMQGWIVPPGNPDNIVNIHDITRLNLPFVNRQKGAGTRLLFDDLLKKANICTEEINGYQREEHTHLNVAAAVAAGTARIGLGILPAAKSFGLDFVPLQEERYDLLMSREFFASDKGQLIMDIITDAEFIRKAENMGGYSMREAGQVKEPL